MNLTLSLTYRARSCDQGGAATLLMAIVLLIAMSMIGVYAARSTVVEQRVAANTVWSQQAADAAQVVMKNIATITQITLQNLAAGIAPVGGITTITFTNNAVPAGTGIILNNAAISVPAGMIYTANVASSDAFNTLSIEVTVSAANNVAKQVLFEKFTFGSYLKEVPLSVVTALGNQTISNLNTITISPASINRNPKIVNGRTVVPDGASILANTTTFTPAIPNVAILLSGVNSLFNFSPTQFTANFLSDSLTHLRESAPQSITCVQACSDAHLAGKTGFIWIEGDLVLDNITLGNFGAIGNANPNDLNAGTDSTPVLLIVNGNLSITNNTNINGLVIVQGNWDTAGSGGRINGAVLVNGTGNRDGTPGNEAGNFVSTGGLTIKYETFVLRNVQRLGSYVSIVGTWRDF